MRAIIYVRISDDRAGDELGVTRQREDARDLAKLRGWQVVAEHSDNDISAAGVKTRPGFDAVLAAMASGEVGAVIAWDMSRLTRNRRDLQRIIDAGQGHGVCIAFVRGSDVDLSTPAGRLIVDVLGGVARHEIDQKADRSRRAILQAAQAGRWVGGRRPFGFEPDGVTVRPVEAEALVKAFDDVLVGASLGQVARDWNGAGLWTPQAPRRPKVDGVPMVGPLLPSRWTPQTVRSTLLNPRYAGLRSHVPVESGRLLHPTLGRLAGIVGEAEWPALVPEEVWRAAVDVLLHPSRAKPARSGVGLLTGIAWCGTAGCEARVHCGGAQQRGKRWRTYRCRASSGHVCRSAVPVERYVRDVMVERLSRRDAVELLVDETRPDAVALRREARALRVRIRGLAALFGEGVLDEAGVRAESARLRGELARVESQQLDAGRVDLLGPLVRADDVGAAWDDLGTDRQRMVVDSLMRVVLLPPGRGTRVFREESVEIKWRR